MIRVELADRTVRVHDGDNLTVEVAGSGVLRVADADTARVSAVYMPGIWSAAMQAPDSDTATGPLPTAAMPVARAEAVTAAWCEAHGVDLSEHDRGCLAALLVEVAGSQTVETERLPRVGDHLTEADGARWDVAGTRYTQGPDRTRMVVEYEHRWPVVGQQLAEGPAEPPADDPDDDRYPCSCTHGLGRHKRGQTGPDPCLLCPCPDYHWIGAE